MSGIECQSVPCDLAAVFSLGLKIIIIFLENALVIIGHQILEKRQRLFSFFVGSTCQKNYLLLVKL